ncbi:MAG TPA: transaldolase family protein [Stellaceae bacterium]|nr:transaldolase family protein [Stellaceae bacterium]
MKLFLDSANLQDVEESLARGFISGVTTNPSLLSKEPKANFFGHVDRIVELLEASGRPVSLSVEVFASKPDEMIAQALEIRERIPYQHLAIKIPIGWGELRAVDALARRGIAVNCTCMFTEEQAILAANAGARYVSIFMCRLKDIGGDPAKVIANTRQILDRGRHSAEIIVGSIRSQSDILEAHLAGGHIVTAGYKILEGTAVHPQTDKSVQGFLKDFEAWIS